MEKAVDEAKAKGITGTGPFEYPGVGAVHPARDRASGAASDAGAEAVRADSRATDHGHPADVFARTAAVHIQIERADGLDLRRVKVPTPISRLLKLSLGATIAQAAAHERRHMAQARRVRERVAL